MAELNTTGIISDTMYRAVIKVTVQSIPLPTRVIGTINISITPQIPVFPDTPTVAEEVLQIKPLALPLASAIDSVVNTSIGDKIDKYFDDARVLKTLLVLQNDRQELLTNWKFDTSDTTNTTIVGKLYRPLPDDVQTQDLVWIGREISETIVDKFLVQISPVESQLIYLRPANRNISVAQYYGVSIENKTLSTLLPSASAPISSSLIVNRDKVLEKYYTTALEGAELNLDYADYRTFIHFGSAAYRLQIFKNKLQLLEQYNSAITSQSLILSASTSGIVTSSVAYNTILNLSNDRLSLFRSFDGYERFLYYGSGSAYSSSLTYDSSDYVYYHTDATWPKTNGVVDTIYQATTTLEAPSVIFPEWSTVSQSWYDNQMYIAAQYDKINENYLINNIPSYLLEDSASIDYITFINMIGNHFDMIKPYIDKMTDIYNRDSDPNAGLSKDLAWTIANSLGIELPNQYAITDLVRYSVGITDTSTKIYRDSAAEIWKRFLHNYIHLLKTKGTKTAINSLINIYGLNPSIIRIRETETPATLYATQSYEIFEEKTNALLTSASYINVPFSSSLRNPVTVEVRLSTSSSLPGTIFNVGNSWAVTFATSSANSASGQISLVDSSSTTQASVDGIPLGIDSFFNVMVRKDLSDIILDVKKYDGDTLIFTGSALTSNAGIFGNWYSGSNLYLGGSGSYFAQPFVGYIDEFRMWGMALSSSVFDLHAKNPAAYFGNDENSTYTNLFARLSFNIPMNLGTSSVVMVPNESPYINFNTQTPSLSAFSASNFANSTIYPYSTDIFTRYIYRYSQVAGGTQYSTNKILIAPAATLQTVVINSSSVPVLYRDKSIVSLNTKQTYKKPNNKIGFYVSTTDEINDSIIRSMGTINIQNYIGDPQALYSSSYSGLDTLNTLYATKYAYTYDKTALVKIVKNIISPLFKQIKYFVPAKAKVFTGIVVEPTILQRNRVKSRPVIVEGANTRQQLLFNNMGTFNGDGHISESALPLLTSENIQLSADYNLALSSIAVSSSLVDLKANYSITGSSEIITAELSTFGSVVPVSGVYQISSDIVNIPALIDVTSILTDTYKIAGGVDDNSTWIIEPINPISDIDYSLAASQYFYNVSGTYPIIQTIKIRVNNSQLSYKGDWVAGTQYTKDDVVLQNSVSGSGSAGNGVEWRCLTTNVLATLGSSTGSVVGFVSYIPPSLDPTNWTQVGYITSNAIVIYKVVNIGGILSLVSPSSPLVPFYGYHPTHYRYHRDNSTGTKNRNYIGCKQTIDTTLDGKSPIEIFSAPGDKLYVAQNVSPVIQSSNTTGPILDVR